MSYWTVTRLASWGSSMYGGYYAECIINDVREWFHAETLKELRKKVEKACYPCGEKIVFSKGKRIDNI